MAKLEFDGRYGGPHTLIAAAQNLTANWVDLGAELPVGGARVIGLYVELDINGSTNARVRAMAKHESAGTLEYALPIRTAGASSIAVEPEYMEFNVDADQNVLLIVEPEGLALYVQFQVQAGAVGAPAGQIDSAVVMTAY
jgi:hypothetical protein